MFCTLFTPLIKNNLCIQYAFSQVKTLLLLLLFPKVWRTKSLLAVTTYLQIYPLDFAQHTLTLQ